MTPMVAASTSTVKSPLSANGMPAATMRAAPTINIFFRPRRSAWRVIQSEMSVSPTSVRVSSRPMRASLNPSSARYSTSTTDRNPYENIRAARVTKSRRPSGPSRGSRRAFDGTGPPGKSPTVHLPGRRSA